MKRPIAGVAIITVVAVALYGLFATAYPRDLVVSRFLSAAERSSGMRIRVDGTVGFTVFPRPTITAKRVTLESRDGTRVWSLGDVTARLRLMPLLTGEIGFADAVLTGATIKARVGGHEPGSLNRLLDAMVDDRLGRLVLRKSVLTLDLGTGQSETFADADVTVTRSGGAGIALNATALWRGETTRFSLSLGDLPAMLAGTVRSAVLTLSSPSRSLVLDGRAAFGPGANFDGRIEFATDAPARFVTLFGWRSGGLPAGMAVRLVGTGQVTPGHISISGAQFDIGGASAMGALAVHWMQPRIVVQGTLAFDRLSLDAAGLAWQPVADLRAMPVVQPGFLANPVDLDLRLSVADLIFGAVSLQRLAGSLIARQGVISLDLGEATLLDASINGRLRLDGAPDRPDVSLTAAVRNVGLARLVSASGAAGMLAAKGSAKAQCATLGACLDALRGTIDVTASGVTLPAALVDAWLSGTPEADGTAQPFGAFKADKATARAALADGRVSVSALSLGATAKADVKTLVVDTRNGTYRAAMTIRKVEAEAPGMGQTQPVAEVVVDPASPGPVTDATAMPAAADEPAVVPATPVAAPSWSLRANGTLPPVILPAPAVGE